ncbi:MAG TPA: glycoside hydrolase family 2 protein, partial [Acidobacteriaceae bacterium]|nr:glycoside hydrolase family 2 protein [Acidobacteriaceae bacterium]
WLAAKSSDYRALDKLPPANVTATATLSGRANGEDHITVQLTNSGSSVALENKLTLLKAGDGARILPAYYSDNYVSLLPGETREVEVSYPASATQGSRPEFTLRGWNLASRTVGVSGGN